jgi:ATP-dependent exoDNAse (exonuclease V) alpha subunit
MSLMNDFSKLPGARKLNIGDLNRQATVKRPLLAEPKAPADPLAGITITAEYLKVKEQLESGNQIVFVSGKAGTGKSTLIKYLRHTYKSNIVVVAPTGVAALNVQGVTLHSYFKLPPRIVTDDDIKEVTDRRLYRYLDLLIVDEISMVRVDLVDAMDKFLRLNGRDKGKPFGGTQLLLVGDMFQLPPVVQAHEQKLLDERKYASPYFFSAKSLDSCDITPIELTEIFRQRDQSFADLLNKVRVGEDLETTLKTINTSCTEKRDEPSVITLSCTNAVADKMNLEEQSKLAGEEKTYIGKIVGSFKVEDDRLPSPADLALKVGAQVMFTKNDEERRWVNGTLGRVVRLQDSSVTVELLGEDKGIIHEVLPVEWESYVYEYDAVKEKIVPKVSGKYVQIPLMLAWAVTIHKSQGKTLEKVRVDLGSGAFASGQVYVALSRCRSLEDIRLTRPIKTSEVKCDPIILRFTELLSKQEDR